MIQMNCMYRTLLATAALAVSGATASAETFFVPAGGDIQAAIDLAMSGDVIQLEAGLYQPSATLEWVDKSLTIAGVVSPVTDEPISVIDGQDAIRLIYANGGASLSLRGISFERGRAEDYGVLWISGVEVFQLTQCSIRDSICVNPGTGGGAAAVAAGILAVLSVGEVLIEDCVVESNQLVNTQTNSTVYNGAYGVLYLTLPDQVEIRSSTIRNNTMIASAGVAGISLFQLEGDLRVTECVFESNVVEGLSELPGGIYFWSNTNSLDVDACRFSGHDSGAVRVYSDLHAPQQGQKISFKDCEFLSNRSESLYYSAGLDITVGLQSFPGNTDTCSYQIIGCAFVDNQSNGNGGAMQLDGGPLDRFAVADCHFEGNSGLSGGAVASEIPFGSSSDSSGIYGARGQSFLNCRFLGNESEDRGGAIHFKGRAHVIDCEFVGNTAGASGGAISFEEQLTVARSTFDSNTASSGGAMAAYDAQGQPARLIASDCHFQENLATGSAFFIEGGGALFLSSEGTVLGCEFHANRSSGFGSAILANGNIDIAGSVFLGNVVDGFDQGGGAIDLQNDFSGGTCRSTNFCENLPRDFGNLHPPIEPADDCLFDTCDVIGDTLSVCRTGCDFSSLQAAIDQANTGDRILVDSAISVGEIELRGKRIRIEGLPGRGGGLPRIGKVRYSGLETTETELVLLSIGYVDVYETAADAMAAAVRVDRCVLMNDPPLDDDYWAGCFKFRSPSRPNFVDVTDSVFESSEFRIVNHRGKSPATFLRCHFGDSAELDGSPYYMDQCSFGPSENERWDLGSFGKYVYLRDCEVDECSSAALSSNAVFDLGGNEFAYCSGECQADLDGDGLVGGADLGFFFAAWGSSFDEADLNADGIVDGIDLGILFSAWGPCQ